MSEKEPKKPKYTFTPVGDNLKGKLIHGVVLGKDTLKDFEIRVARTGDMFDAEELASPLKMLAYKGALLSCQIVRLGDIEGPIDFDLIRKLHPEDFDMLTDAMDQVEASGKDSSSHSGAGTNASSS